MPVGQGAFYAEKFAMGDEKPHTIVYDCGSWKAPRARKLPKALEEEINGLGYEHDTIDILFISHFDADHVNGIQELNERYDIKKIVLPEISENLWYLYALGYYIGQEETMSNLATFLSNNIDKLVEVQPAREGEDFNPPADEGINILEEPNDNDLNSGQGKHKIKIPSGKPLNASEFKEKVYWCYKPINYEITSQQLDSLKNNIISELAAIGISISKDDFDKTETIKSTIVTHTREFKAAFKKSGIETNKSSMIVYSGPSIEHSGCYLNFQLYYRHIALPDYRRYWNREPACLYTGDSVLNDIRFSSIAIYIQKQIQNIGTFQIPHHGSGNNINVGDIQNGLGLDIEGVLCFASYGKKNVYHHPSFNVVSDLYLHYSPLWGVTEDKDTQLIESIRYEW